MENKTKAETFIGFAIRAKKFRIGANAVQTLKSANLIIACFSASENTKKQAEKIAGNFKCPLLITKEKSLEDITFKENAKVMAITDKALAKAILDNSEKDFIAKK